MAWNMGAAARLAGGLVVLGLMGALSACRLLDPRGTSTYTGYSARVLDINTILDLDARSFRVKETQVYASTGKLSGRIVYTYDDAGLNTEVDTYTVTTAGDSIRKEHQVITNDPATGLVTLNESFDLANVRQSWFEVQYKVGYPDLYTLSQHWANEGGTDVLQSKRVATYLTAPGTDLDGKLRTEQLFIWDETLWKLNKETAFWYDTDGNLLSQIDHVIRGSDVAADAVLPAGVDERYFYSAYSRNPQGHVFSKIQYLYEHYVDVDADGRADPDEFVAALRTAAGFPLTPANPDPFLYDINSDAVKYQVGMEISDYDGQGNLVRQTTYSYGVLQEVRTYAYLEPGFETERASYVSGGTVLDQKIVTRYGVESIGSVDYWIKDAITYNIDDLIKLDEDQGGTQ